MANKTSEIALALAAIAATNGGKITPDQVVEAARDPASPLHDSFEWDDTVAAIAHRQDQARTLIRSVEIRVQIGETVLRAPQYIRDPSQEAKTQGYITVAKLRSEEDLAREAVVAEFVRASAALTRAKSIAAVLGQDISDKIADVEAQVRTAANGIQPAAPAQ